MPSDSKQLKVINLTLRDGQQSTMAQEDWVFDPSQFAKVISTSQAAGYGGAEIAGGQSFQISITCGYNPFTILSSISHALKYGDCGEGFDLQMLFRGANALGFRHYDRNLVEMTIEEFIKCGITKIRFFDALNDIDNLKLSDGMKNHEGVILEGAVCFTHYAAFPERYSDTYFVRYAAALIEEGYNAIAIKDMSGQLTAERVSKLVPALLDYLDPRGIPLSLHVHSTHEENSKQAIQKALEYGVAAIETAEGVLSGGASHHSLKTISPDLIKDEVAFDQMTKVIATIWGAAPDRKDQQIPDEVKEQLCAAGVPGGAMPFVMRDLKQQQSTIRAKHKASQHVTDSSRVEDVKDFSAVVDLFIAELKQVCVDAGLPLLVTPTADICCKQAIANLAFGADPYAGTLAGRYLNTSRQPNPDTRYAKLVLGYYGELKSYDDGVENYRPSKSVVNFFEANNGESLGSSLGIVPTTSGDDLRDAQQQAWKLIQKLGDSALSFASFDQLTILYALKPYTAQMSDDPILKSVEIYLKRSERSKIDGRGKTFPGYENMMQPLLCYMKAMVVIDKDLEAEDLLEIPLADFGEMLCSQLFDIYIDLDIWGKVTDLLNHLSKLFSSSHIPLELMQAAHYVSDTMEQLDLRPNQSDMPSIERAFGRFEKFNIAELFGSLALITSFVNDVAKHATNPSIYAERSLTMDDISKYLEQDVKRDYSDWEAGIRQSVVSKNMRLEGDFQKRLEGWRM